MTSGHFYVFAATLHLTQNINKLNTTIIVVGSFQLTFQFNTAHWCTDPTVYTETLGPGRFFNHSCIAPNIKATALPYQREDSHWYPRVVLFALGHIPSGTELRWNYGDLQPEILEQPGMQWMKDV